LGFHDLIGATPTWNDVTERLQRYGLGQILSVLSRISVMLEHFGPWRHPEAQKRLCDGLFGPKSGQVWSAVLKWIRKHKEEEGFEVTPTLFHELQVVSLAKAAFLTLEVNTTETTAALDGLAEALLMVNDLTGSLVGATGGPDPSTPDGFRIWHQYFVANGLFHHGETEVHSLPRAYDLYLTDKPHLRNDPSYVDLPELIRQATGLEPDTLWFVLFAFMAH